MSTTVRSLKKDRDEELKDLRRQIKETEKDFATRIAECEKHGGYCDSNEAGSLLGCTRQRVGTLIKDGRIRKVTGGRTWQPDRLSLGDVLHYKKNRHNGHPPKGYQAGAKVQRKRRRLK